MLAHQQHILNNFNTEEGLNRYVESYKQLCAELVKNLMDGNDDLVVEKSVQLAQAQAYFNAHIPNKYRVLSLFDNGIYRFLSDFLDDPYLYEFKQLIEINRDDFKDDDVAAAARLKQRLEQRVEFLNSEVPFLLNQHVGPFSVHLEPRYYAQMMANRDKTDELLIELVKQLVANDPARADQAYQNLLKRYNWLKSIIQDDEGGLKEYKIILHYEINRIIHDFYAMGSVLPKNLKQGVERLKNSKTWFNAALGNKKELNELFTKLTQLVTSLNQGDYFFKIEDTPFRASNLIMNDPLNQGYAEDRHLLIHYVAGQSPRAKIKHPWLGIELIKDAVLIAEFKQFTPLFVAMMAYRVRERQANVEECAKLKETVQFLLASGAFFDDLQHYIPVGLLSLFSERPNFDPNQRNMNNESSVAENIRNLEQATVLTWMEFPGFDYKNINQAGDSVLDLAVTNLSFRHSVEYLSKEEQEDYDREQLPKIIDLVSAIIRKDPSLFNAKALTQAVLHGDPQTVDWMLQLFNRFSHIEKEALGVALRDAMALEAQEPSYEERLNATHYLRGKFRECKEGNHKKVMWKLFNDVAHDRVNPYYNIDRIRINGAGQENPALYVSALNKKRYCAMASVLSKYMVFRTPDLQREINNFVNKNDLEALEKAKKKIIALLDRYISCWKLSLFGHHHNARAEAFKNAISKANDFVTLKAILASQMKFFLADYDRNFDSDLDAQLLEQHWTERMKNTIKPTSYRDNVSIYWLDQAVEGNSEKLNKMKSGETEVKGDALIFVNDSTFYRVINGKFIYQPIATDLRTHQEDFVSSPQLGMKKMIDYLKAQVFDENGQMKRVESNQKIHNKILELTRELNEKFHRHEINLDEYHRLANEFDLPWELDNSDLDNLFIKKILKAAHLNDCHYQSSGYYRVLKKATLIVDSTESQMHRLEGDLTQYIDRIESHKTADGQTNFAHGFSIFKNSRALNRQANYELATELRQTLRLDNIVDGAVKLSRDTKERLLERRGEIIANLHLNEEADFVDRGMNSEELMAIIDRAAMFKR